MKTLPVYLSNLIQVITSDEIYPSIHTIEGSSTDTTITINGRQLLLMCSPNYLSLAHHPEVCEAGIRAIEKYGMGTVGSGLVSGYLDLFEELEHKLARFMGTESVIVFNSATIANAGVITSVLDPPLLRLLELNQDCLGSRAVFFDHTNHTSLKDAVRLTRDVDLLVYRHDDMQHLEQLLAASQHATKLVVTDGYFSVDANVAPLTRIAQLAEQYHAMVLVDDAHGTGVLGSCGRGSCEQLGVENEIDFVTHSLAKAFGVRGGFVAGSAEFIKYLRVSARQYVFCGTLPPAIPAALLSALDISEREPWRRATVLASAATLRRGLQEAGFTVLGEAHIVPWLIGDEVLADKVAAELFQNGIFAPALRYPAAEMGKAIIRFMPMADHSVKDIQTVVEVCRRVGEQLHIPPFD